MIVSGDKQPSPASLIYTTTGNLLNSYSSRFFTEGYNLKVTFHFADPILPICQIVLFVPVHIEYLAIGRSKSPLTVNCSSNIRTLRWNAASGHFEKPTTNPLNAAAASPVLPMKTSPLRRPVGFRRVRGLGGGWQLVARYTGPALSEALLSVLGAG